MLWMGLQNLALSEPLISFEMFHQPALLLCSFINP